MSRTVQFSGFGDGQMRFMVQSLGVTGCYVPCVQQACQVARAQYAALVVPSPAFHDCALPAVSASSRCPVIVCVNRRLPRICGGYRFICLPATMRINGGTQDMLHHRNSEVASTLRKDLNHFLTLVTVAWASMGLWGMWSLTKVWRFGWV